ncbi:hypothetical protein MS3_00005888 [Schistosoma haematobium]|uniref:Uncharacterized protein n=1 Tax=Schistosoma haematobium TaxID=6185 RepID=A0A922LLQ8_SCHHA|nr:hypothetical protein MS3_00005888 [Schistosoma haematobium]KAH9588510.1 hypothetical protein MS3_00005888 [Schistosoma haematobium]CAH8571986.1 unnamed protein product [Schistosoma haematobium]
MIDISYNIFMMSAFVSLCSSSSSSSYKKLYKSTTNYGIINNQYINVKSISIEKLKNYFYRLDQLPFIDEMYQNDQYQNIYASFDEFSINGMDNQKNFIKNQSSSYKTSSKLCGCFTRR